MLNQIPHVAWHQLDVEDVARQLDTDPRQGLTPDEAARRQDRFGPNAITASGGPSWFLRFLLQLHQPLIYILLAAGAVTAILGEWIDSSVIFGVVLINAFVGFVQESKAVKALEALSNSVSTDAFVLRGNEKLSLPSAAVTYGDVVLLQSGDKAPADLRLVHVRDLQVDESALTGESLPVEKQSGRLLNDRPISDRDNMVYSSTLVTYGQATGVVVGIGDDTEVGRISELISTAQELATPLTRKVARFSQLLLYAILLLAAATFAIGVVRDESVIEMFMAAVALAVGAIPEGLPAALTIALAIGVARMARRNAVIRKLPAVETLGSTTVICSDKTGTLTKNQMTVQQIFAGGELFDVDGSGYRLTGAIRRPDGSCVNQVDVEQMSALHECLLAGLLCNDSAIENKDGRLRVMGDPTEGALIVSAAKGGLRRPEVDQRWPRIDSIPFESEHQYMATLHRRAASGSVGRKREVVVYVKGAVEQLLSRCESMLNAHGQSVPLDRDLILRQLGAMAQQGLRVLALAEGKTAPEMAALSHADIEQGLTFIGLQAMIDPPRSEAIAAVRSCQKAGISVKMITGDHAITAAAIARQLGLGSSPEPESAQGEPSDLGLADQPNRAGVPLLPEVITGVDLAAMTDEELTVAAEQSAVFARVTPEQKLRLVRALQRRNNIVAMTGDGVNDAPALKQADIGVAMGRGGTEVAKEAADMVLLDDNFATIQGAVEEGRGVFDNIVKFIVWTLPTNVGEGMVIFASVLLGTDLPILPVQILWINMTTAVLLGLTLAFESKEPDIMSRPPRDPRSPILTPVLTVRIVLVGGLLLLGAFGLFEWAQWRGLANDQARTIAVNVFVFGEIFYLFNCRSLVYSALQMSLFSNPWVWLGVSIMTALQVLFTYWAPTQIMFHSTAIGGTEWAAVLAVAAAMFVIVEAEKWLRRKFDPVRTI